METPVVISRPLRPAYCVGTPTGWLRQFNSEMKRRKTPSLTQSDASSSDVPPLPRISLSPLKNTVVFEPPTGKDKVDRFLVPLIKAYTEETGSGCLVIDGSRTSAIFADNIEGMMNSLYLHLSKSFRPYGLSLVVGTQSREWVSQHLDMSIFRNLLAFSTPFLSESTLLYLGTRAKMHICPPKSLHHALCILGGDDDNHDAMFADFVGCKEYEPL